MALYTNLRASILLQEGPAAAFSIHRKFHKGDPLSLILYNVLADVLLFATGKQLKGISVTNQERLKIEAFADGTFVVLGTGNDKEAFVERLQMYQDASNSLVNIKKQ